MRVVRLLLAALLAWGAYAAAAPVELSHAGGEYPHLSRRVLTLDGRWAFGWLGPNVSDVTALAPSGLPTPLVTVVPSSFDLLAYPGKGASLAGARGTALFRTTVTTNPNTLAKLRFGACGFYCAVFVDGVRVGEHGGNGYTSFWVGGVPPSPNATRLLEVLADNRFNSTYAVLHGYVDDWYQYGGLYRSVEWHELGPADTATVAIQAVDVLVVDARRGSVTARVRLHDATETSRLPVVPARGVDPPRYAPRHRGNGGHGLTSLTSLPSSVNLTVSFDRGPATAYANVEVDAHGVAVLVGLSVPSPTLWGEGTPNMHTLTVTVTGSSNGPVPSAQGSGDALTDRFGLRTFTPCPNSNGTGTVLCLNGSPVKLLGYGRHDTSPSLGHALGYMARLQDLLLMQGLGSNFVRIGHYTQDNSVASLADDLGVLAATEVIGWDSSPSVYKDPAWIAASLLALEEHVNNTMFNHPSIVLWAYINEGASNDPTVCPTYALMDARYKALGVNGLTTYASDKGAGDVCITASNVDVPGFNLYPGWYSVGPQSGNIQADTASGVALVATDLDALATWMGAAHPTSPFFVSEIGAGSVPGWTDEMGGVWTEAYAGRLLSAAAQTVVRDDRWSGIALWQLMDQRTYNGVGALSRPRAFNNKGTFDENRKAKLPVYSAVYNAFHGLPPPDWLDAVSP